MMMRNGGDGDEAGKGNVNGDHHQQQQEEGHESLKKFDFPIPPGYRFQPTDEELIKYYLYPKINKLQLPPNSFKDVNIYAFNPWDLADRYRYRSGEEDKVFYFFTPRERKDQCGKIRKRIANEGHWKACGTDRIVDEDTNEEIGYKKTMIFYLRKSPKKPDSKMAKIRISKNVSTDWRMHEYELNQLDDFVLCKLFLTPRKSTENMAVDVAVDVPPSIPTTTSPAVPENQYPLTTEAVTEEMVPENPHYMCQTEVVAAAAAAAADHQYPLISMVAAAVPEEKMSFDYDYLDSVSPSSSSSAVVPSVNHHYSGEVNLHQLQSVILPSVNHKYYGETNQQQLQSVTLPSANHHYNGSGEVNQQQLQSVTLPSANHHYDGYGEVNQRQLQEEILQEDDNGEMNQEQLQSQAEILQQLEEEILQEDCNGEMNQEQLQMQAEILKELQEEISSSANHHTYGQMNQQQQHEEYEWNMPVTEMNNITYGQMNQQQQQQHEYEWNMLVTEMNNITYGQMNQQQQHEEYEWNMPVTGMNNITYGQMNQQQQHEEYEWNMPVTGMNNITYGQMNQQQQHEEYEWNMLVKKMNNIGSQPNFHGSGSFSFLPDIDPR